MSYLTVKEVAARLRVSDLTVRRWIWSGKLPATRVGRLRRIKDSDVEVLTQNWATKPDLSPEPFPPGTVGALLHYLRNRAPTVTPEDVDELERLIEEGCERVEPVKDLFG